MEILSTALGYVMNFCYKLLHDYGLAIILFTLISKIVLLPVSIWVQKNSIKMVKMQPDINRILIKHYGDKDEIYFFYIPNINFTCFAHKKRTLFLHNTVSF